MIRISDRVRHIDETLFQKYGMMEVWEIHDEEIKCRYGTFHTVRLITIPRKDLKVV